MYDNDDKVAIVLNDGDDAGKLIVCYDDNLITIDGDTALTFTEDVNKRYEAYNWHVQTVDDVNDLPQLQNALRNAQLETQRPSLIKVSLNSLVYSFFHSFLFHLIIISVMLTYYFHYFVVFVGNC